MRIGEHHLISLGFSKLGPRMRFWEEVDSETTHTHRHTRMNTQTLTHAHACMTHTHSLCVA